MKTFSLGLTLCCLVSFSAQADSMRCGQKLITEGDSQAKVLSLCGSPSSKAVISEVSDTRFTNYGKHTETVQIEQWIYSQGGGQFNKSLIFKAGSLQRIEIAN